MVDIIIPAYNAHTEIKRALSSVAIQDCLDQIIVSIVDDCSERNYDYLIDEFKYLNLRVLQKPSNTGCGQSRQYGIDRCESDYFMFLDADDVLYVPTCVREMVSCMEQYKLDSLYTNYAEELPDKKLYIHKKEGIHMHGKMYRTRYIQENDIRYSYTRMHEDHAFNAIALLCGGKNAYIDIVTYYWTYNSKSLTRKYADDAHFWQTFEDYFINADYAINECVKRNVDNTRIADLCKTYSFSFYKYYNYLLSQNTSQEKCKEYIGKVKSLFFNLPPEVYSLLKPEYMKQNFYAHPSIRSMIENEIMMEFPFAAYLEEILSKN